MCRPAPLIGPGSKYSQLNPLTTYREQDVVESCWLCAPAYRPGARPPQPAETRARMKHGLFYPRCHHPGWFLSAVRRQWCALQQLTALLWTREHFKDPDKLKS